jgi:hypothetical protein
MKALNSLISKINKRISEKYGRWRNYRRIVGIAQQVSAYAPANSSGQEVIFFRASSGILRTSLNNAFHIIAAWALKLQGVPVVHYTCNAGMSRCVLGTDRENLQADPPCVECTRHSKRTQVLQNSHWFSYTQDDSLAAALQGLDIEALSMFAYQDVPLGELVLPSLRWILRRHHLPDDEPYRVVYREYILSAWSVLVEFAKLLDHTNPRAVVVFNGMFYPEATVGWLARQRGIRVITHEVGLQPFSAFFTDGKATAYPIHIPASFKLSPSQNSLLDSYLEQRFRGAFTMAGIRFWAEMRDLDPALLSKTAAFKQIVPVFTNVVFDTSQVHANSVFPHMFAWLDRILKIAKHHQDTLFIIRAHPDEMREGKQSQESVQDWANHNQVSSQPNILFIGPNEYFSSYEMIGRAKFVMVYNSTIGLEATLMGKPVLCGGKARYTQYPIVFFPQTVHEFERKAQEMLTSDKILFPPEFKENARRFLYYQLYLTSLPFDDYLEEENLPGFVWLKRFSYQNLLPENSPSTRVIVDGILKDGHFLLEE